MRKLGLKIGKFLPYFPLLSHHVQRHVGWKYILGHPLLNQPQALTQVFLNLIVFGMDIQDAIDAPRFSSRNFPDSFSPHEYNPGTIVLEQGLYNKVGKDLESMGYKIEVVEDWHYEMGAVCAIIRDSDTGTLIAGADPRQENWADGL